ncbi:MAG: hypothetical protein EBZ13_06265 [Planctomycetia bacterium]|nr:hypothetical protein [Planctomycetia bacterium]
MGASCWRVFLLLIAICLGAAQFEVARAAEPAAGGAGRRLNLLTPAELQIRYAEARQQLAELNLERATKANQLVPNAVGPREVVRLSRHVDLTRRQADIAKENPRTTVKQTNLAAAEIAVANVRDDLEAARKANERTAKDVKLAAVAAVNMQRLEAMLEMAEIHLELLNRPNYVPSLIDEMQWHIDQLTNEVIDLRHQLETGGNNTFGVERP